MIFSNADGAYDIFIQPKKGETEEMALQAIAAASFELALSNSDGRTTSFQEARGLVRASVKMSNQPGAMVIEMAQVGGRWCVTFVERVGTNHFRLSNAYQQYRGVPDPMLKRAQAILQTEIDSQSD